MNRIEVRDMTGLYKKELLLYSLFDVSFKTPVRLMRLVYFVLVGIVWAPWWILLLGLSPWSIGIALSVPIVLSDMMSKPMWGGKSFMAFFKTQMAYISNPKIYYDNYASKKLGTYKVEHEYTVSRAIDYYKLLQLEKEEYKLRKKKRK